MRYSKSYFLTYSLVMRGHFIPVILQYLRHESRNITPPPKSITKRAEKKYCLILVVYVHFFANLPCKSKLLFEKHNSQASTSFSLFITSLLIWFIPLLQFESRVMEFSFLFSMTSLGEVYVFPQSHLTVNMTKTRASGSDCSLDCGCDRNCCCGLKAAFFLPFFCPPIPAIRASNSARDI